MVVAAAIVAATATTSMVVAAAIVAATATTPMVVAAAVVAAAAAAAIVVTTATAIVVAAFRQSRLRFERQRAVVEIRRELHWGRGKQDRKRGGRTQAKHQLVRPNHRHPP
jgi:hypothetical protein